MGLSTGASSRDIKTFVMLDFFANESVNTEVVEGIEPEFNQIFSFRNIVDNFYIRSLKEKCMKAEIYAVKRGRNQNAVKIGEA